MLAPKWILLSIMVSMASLGYSAPKFQCLDSRISRTDARYATFYRALQLIRERKAQVIIETGTARGGGLDCTGDGCFTLILAGWVKENGGQFYSVDISEGALLMAGKGLKELKKFVHLIQRDSVEFLANFNQPIDFLYLDSYDYEKDNPYPSQLHQLREIQAAMPLLTEKSVVMLDDCNLPEGGKCKLTIDYLLGLGWKIIHRNYQIIFIK